MRFTVKKRPASRNPSARGARPKTTTTIRANEPVRSQLGSESYHLIEAVLGYTFKDYSWLERALTHRSALDVNSPGNDYERLEFLGDAVLDLAIAHLLLDAHKDSKEGDLSKMRAAIVNTASLAEVARTIELNKFIRLSQGELANGGSERPSILADVLEALMGAIYRDSDYPTVFNCISKLFSLAAQTVMPSDPKTELQELLHVNGSEAPEYLLEYTEGPEHAPTFVSIVRVDGQIAGRGTGPTKKSSQQAAAAEALLALKKEDPIDAQFLVAK